MARTAMAFQIIAGVSIHGLIVKSVPLALRKP